MAELREAGVFFALTALANQQIDNPGQESQGRDGPQVKADHPGNQPAELVDDEGTGDMAWKATVASFVGLTAKENVVATLATLYGFAGEVVGGQLHDEGGGLPGKGFELFQHDAGDHHGGNADEEGRGGDQSPCWWLLAAASPASWPPGPLSRTGTGK